MNFSNTTLIRDIEKFSDRHIQRLLIVYCSLAMRIFMIQLALVWKDRQSLTKNALFRPSTQQQRHLVFWTTALNTSFPLNVQIEQ